MVLSLAASLAALASPVLAHSELSELEVAVDERVAGNPDAVQPYLEQGHVYRLGKKWDRALAAFQHAADHGAVPEVIEAARAQVFLDAEWPRMAIVHFDRALALAPEASTTRFERGRAWRLLGDYTRASQDFEQGIAKMSTPRPEHFFEWRDLYLAAEKPEAALAALDEGVRRLGDVPSLHLAALQIEETLAGDAALQRIDKLLAQNPRNESWLTRRGQILERQGREEEAQAAFRKALELIEIRPRHRRGERIAALEAELMAKLDAKKLENRESK